MSAKKWTPEVITYLAELAKTNSYIELAEIYKIDPSRMHKILQNNSIKSVSKASSNTGVESRLQKGKTRTLEFRVLGKTKEGGIIRNGWFTLKIITAWPECDCTKPALTKRFNRVGDIYDDAYQAIIEPLKKRVNTKPKVKVIDKDFIAEIKAKTNLWPIGSMYKKAKIMQSVRY